MKYKVPKAMLFQLSADTRLIYQFLQTAKVGVMVPFSEIGRKIGVPGAGNLPALSSARRKLLRDKGIVFGVVRGEGIKRLSDDEIVEAAVADRASVRRKARKAATKLMMVDYEKLSVKNKTSFTAELSLFGAISKLAEDKSLAKLENHVRGKSELPLLETVIAVKE